MMSLFSEKELDKMKTICDFATLTFPLGKAVAQKGDDNVYTVKATYKRKPYIRITVEQLEEMDYYPCSKYIAEFISKITPRKVARLIQELRITRKLYERNRRKTQ